MEVKLSRADEKFLRLDEIPAKHEGDIKRRLNEELAIYARKKPDAKRRDLLVAAASGMMNNFHGNFPGGYREATMKYLGKKPTKEEKAFRAKLEGVMKAAGFDGENWIKRLHQSGLTGGFQGNALGEKTKIHFEAWPVFLKMLEHVDDPHDLWG